MLLLVVLYLFAPTFLSGIFSTVVSPLWKIGEKSPESFINEYSDASIEELRMENESLKSMLGRQATSTFTLAYVLKKPPFTSYDNLIIDIGEKNKVKVGEKVYAPGSILIGELVEIGAATSKVKLYSSYGEKYEVSLGVGTTSESILVAATGRGGGAFEITIPRDMKVKIGQPITIPGINNNVFGIVKDVIREENKTFATILFSQPLNIYEIKWVELYLQ